MTPNTHATGNTALRDVTGRTALRDVTGGTALRDVTGRTALKHPPDGPAIPLQQRETVYAPHATGHAAVKDQDPLRAGTSSDGPAVPLQGRQGETVR